jgi:hypothetical protein
MVTGVRDRRLEGSEAGVIDPGDEDTVGAFGKPGRNRRDLVRRLAETEDYLRQGVAQAAVVVDLGETKVFVRNEAQVFESGLDAKAAARNGIEQVP